MNGYSITPSPARLVKLFVPAQVCYYRDSAWFLTGQLRYFDILTNSNISPLTDFSTVCSASGILLLEREACAQASIEVSTMLDSPKVKVWALIVYVVLVTHKHDNFVSYLT